MYGATTRLRGFTLIELLVVISIIGLLSSIILASLSSSKEKAINARITSDVNEYQNALELYYSKYGHYPVPADTGFYCLGTGYSGGGCWTGSTPNDANVDALSEFIPGPPKGQTVVGSTHTFSGYIYKCQKSGSACNGGKGYIIYYVVSGQNPPPVNNISPLCQSKLGTHRDVTTADAAVTECQLTVPS